MIEFYSETNFQLNVSNAVTKWNSDSITSEGYEEGDIAYIFCDDAYLHKLNVEFLDHDTFTDIISFDYTLGKQVHGEIYISVERVKENAIIFSTDFEAELHRVMIHGILHFCGFKDKLDADAALMRKKEDEALKRRTFV